MPGTIDSAVTSKSDDKVDQAAKRAQQKAEEERIEKKKEGPVDQAPGEMPPDQR